MNFHQFFVEEYMRFALRNDHIIITFSTTPHRINKIGPTMQSIVDQNIKVDGIYLAVPYVFKRENIPYVIPEWLLQHPKLTIIRTDDYGPATKLLGVLKNLELDPNTIIITMDDDITYPKNLALQLAYRAKQEPKSAIGICGGDVNYDDAGILVNNDTGGFIQAKSYKNAAILEGFASIAYHRNFFAEDIFDINTAPRECINSDDVYLAFYLAKNNIPRQIFENRYIDKDRLNFKNEIGWQSDALRAESECDRHRSCLAFLKEKYPGVQF